MFRAQNRAQKNSKQKPRFPEVSHHDERLYKAPVAQDSPVGLRYRPSLAGGLVAVRGPGTLSLVIRSLSELRHHPSWVKHNLGLSVAGLSAAATNWNPSKPDPISTTRDGTILKGHEVCEVARRAGLERVSCLKYNLDEARLFCGSSNTPQQDQELTSYQRIVLALDYEPSLRRYARENQREVAIQSLTISEAQAINCRREIAKSAGVSEGTLAKVTRLLRAGRPELLEAVREG